MAESGPWRMIDGELWIFHNAFRTKLEARRETERLRGTGQRTRTLKRVGVKFIGRPRWRVYRKPKAGLTEERRRLAAKYISLR